MRDQTRKILSRAAAQVIAQGEVHRPVDVPEAIEQAVSHFYANRDDPLTLAMQVEALSVVFRDAWTEVGRREQQMILDRLVEE